MKLVDDNGKEFEISLVDKTCEDGDIILKSPHSLRREDINLLEKEYSAKFGRKVIILDARFSDIFIVKSK